jgi:hypothetical protein
MHDFEKKFFIVKEATSSDFSALYSTFGTDSPPPASDGSGRLVAFAISRFEICYLQAMGAAMKHAHNSYVKEYPIDFIDSSIIPSDSHEYCTKILSGEVYTIAHTLYPWAKIIPSIDDLEIDFDLKDILCNRGFVEITEGEFASIKTSVQLSIEVPITGNNDFCFIINDSANQQEELHTYVIGIDEMLILHFN